MFVIQRAIHAQRGFTLVELAIVLVIIGVLVGGFLGTFGSRIDATRNANTKEELGRIKQAILGYALVSGGPLPCPDIDGDGLEDRDTAGACDSGDTVGTAPWVTLGMPSADGWNTRYRYWVDKDFADTGTGNEYTLTVGADGSILTRKPDGTDTLLSATSVAAVLFSHGKNGYGGVSASGEARSPSPNKDEKDNVNADLDFVSRPPTEAGASSMGGEFDDIVVWISEYELKATMAEAGILP